jgi:hypothetical protein
MIRSETISLLEDPEYKRDQKLKSRSKGISKDGSFSGNQVESNEEKRDTLNDQVLSIFNEMRSEEAVKIEINTKKIIENSIFDFVVEMEKQFDELFSDIDEIKRQERRRKNRSNCKS